MKLLGDGDESDLVLVEDLHDPSKIEQRATEAVRCPVHLLLGREWRSLLSFSQRVANRLYLRDEVDMEKMRRALQIHALPEGWRRYFTQQREQPEK
jgi:hypothetical protein